MNWYQGDSLDNSALKRAAPKKYNTGVEMVTITREMKNRLDQSSILLPNVKYSVHPVIRANHNLYLLLKRANLALTISSEYS